MKRKIFCLFTLLFLTAGCEVTYELNIEGEDFKENTDIIENDNNNLNSMFNGITYRELYEDYIKKPIPVSNQYEIQPDSDEEITGVRYYEKEDSSNDNAINFSLTNTFPSGGIQDSTVINNGYNRFIKATIDNHIVLSTGERLKAFDQYSVLDKVTIKIRTDHEVIEHNADEIDNGTYIWYVDRENYTDKSVYFEIATEEPKESDESSFFSNAKIILFILGGIFAVAVIVIIFIAIKRKMNNRL